MPLGQAIQEKPAGAIVEQLQVQKSLYEGMDMMNGNVSGEGSNGHAVVGPTDEHVFHHNGHNLHTDGQSPNTDQLPARPAPLVPLTQPTEPTPEAALAPAEPPKKAVPKRKRPTKEEPNAAKGLPTAEKPPRKKAVPKKKKQAVVPPEEQAMQMEPVYPDMVMYQPLPPVAPAKYQPLPSVTNLLPPLTNPHSQSHPAQQQQQPPQQQNGGGPMNNNAMNGYGYLDVNGGPSSNSSSSMYSYEFPNAGQEQANGGYQQNGMNHFEYSQNGAGSSGYSQNGYQQNMSTGYRHSGDSEYGPASIRVSQMSQLNQYNQYGNNEYQQAAVYTGGSSSSSGYDTSPNNPFPPTDFNPLSVESHISCTSRDSHAPNSHYSSMPQTPISQHSSNGSQYNAMPVSNNSSQFSQSNGHSQQNAFYEHPQTPQSVQQQDQNQLTPFVAQGMRNSASNESEPGSQSQMSAATTPSDCVIISSGKGSPAVPECAVQPNTPVGKSPLVQQPGETVIKSYRVVQTPSSETAQSYASVQYIQSDGSQSVTNKRVMSEAANPHIVGENTAKSISVRNRWNGTGRMTEETVPAAVPAQNITVDSMVPANQQFGESLQKSDNQSLYSVHYLPHETSERYNSRKSQSDHSCPNLMAIFSKTKKEGQQSPVKMQPPPRPPPPKRRRIATNDMNPVPPAMPTQNQRQPETVGELVQLKLAKEKARNGDDGQLYPQDRVTTSINSVVAAVNAIPLKSDSRPYVRYQQSLQQVDHASVVKKHYNQAVLDHEKHRSALIGDIQKQQKAARQKNPTKAQREKAMAKLQRENALKQQQMQNYQQNQMQQQQPGQQYTVTEAYTVQSSRMAGDPPQAAPAQTAQQLEMQIGMEQSLQDYQQTQELGTLMQHQNSQQLVNGKQLIQPQQLQGQQNRNQKKSVNQRGSKQQQQLENYHMGPSTSDPRRMEMQQPPNQQQHRPTHHSQPYQQEINVQHQAQMQRNHADHQEPRQMQQHAQQPTNEPMSVQIPQRPTQLPMNSPMQYQSPMKHQDQIQQSMSRPGSVQVSRQGSVHMHHHHESQMSRRNSMSHNQHQLEQSGQPPMNQPEFGQVQRHQAQSQQPTNQQISVKVPSHQTQYQMESPMRYHSPVGQQMSQPRSLQMRQQQESPMAHQQQQLQDRRGSVQMQRNESRSSRPGSVQIQHNSGSPMSRQGSGQMQQRETQQPVNQQMTVHVPPNQTPRQMDSPVQYHSPMSNRQPTPQTMNQHGCVQMQQHQSPANQQQHLQNHQQVNRQGSMRQSQVAQQQSGQQYQGQNRRGSMPQSPMPQQPGQPMMLSPKLDNPMPTQSSQQTGSSNQQQYSAQQHQMSNQQGFSSDSQQATQQHPQQKPKPSRSRKQPVGQRTPPMYQLSAYQPYTTHQANQQQAQIQQQVLMQMQQQMQKSAPKSRSKKNKDSATMPLPLQVNAHIQYVDTQPSRVDYHHPSPPSDQGTSASMGNPQLEGMNPAQTELFMGTKAFVERSNEVTAAQMAQASVATPQAGPQEVPPPKKKRAPPKKKNEPNNEQALQYSPSGNQQQGLSTVTTEPLSRNKPPQMEDSKLRDWLQQIAPPEEIEMQYQQQMQHQQPPRAPQAQMQMSQQQQANDFQGGMQMQGQQQMPMRQNNQEQQFFQSQNQQQPEQGFDGVAGVVPTNGAPVTNQLADAPSPAQPTANSPKTAKKKSHRATKPPQLDENGQPVVSNTTRWKHIRETVAEVAAWPRLTVEEIFDEEEDQPVTEDDYFEFLLNVELEFNTNPCPAELDVDDIIADPSLESALHGRLRKRLHSVRTGKTDQTKPTKRVKKTEEQKKADALKKQAAKKTVAPRKSAASKKSEPIKTSAGTKSSEAKENADKAAVLAHTIMTDFKSKENDLLINPLSITTGNPSMISSTPTSSQLMTPATPSSQESLLAQTPVTTPMNSENQEPAFHSLASNTNNVSQSNQLPAISPVVVAQDFEELAEDPFQYMMSENDPYLPIVERPMKEEPILGYSDEPENETVQQQLVISVEGAQYVSVPVVTIHDEVIPKPDMFSQPPSHGLAGLGFDNNDLFNTIHSPFSRDDPLLSSVKEDDEFLLERPSSAQLMNDHRSSMVVPFEDAFDDLFATPEKQSSNSSDRSASPDLFGGASTSDFGASASASFSWESAEWVPTI
ncbi:hypothetical protein B9Z55_024152 [Caenorhabditis nigoni]|uniref:Uncharacterized protein n=1 Tax=Caenorhabditis nigoni TaxID=1611254 RepID=A0A2G5ST65_9PELO|nr:hypothetical protein B9Z55_024152 [Caenorhabditis nigoni]